MFGRLLARRGDADTEATPASDETGQVDRRGMLRLGGLAAAGAAGAAIVTVFDAVPAGATTGAMTFGTGNQAGTSFTTLDSTNISYTFNVLNSGQGIGLFVNSETGECAHLRQNGTTGTGDALHIEKNGAQGYGMYLSTAGDHAGIQIFRGSTTAAAVVDAFQEEAGVVYKATSADATNADPLLQGQHFGVGPGVQIALMKTTNASPVINASTAGTGRGAKIALTNRANTSAGLAATTIGTGRALYGEIDNPASLAPAIEGDTNGAGAAVYGGTTGTGEAILGNGRAKARGAVLISNVAQMKLQPGSLPSHPASGQAGDLYVDKSARLWFCKGGVTWKQLA